MVGQVLCGHCIGRPQKTTSMRVCRGNMMLQLCFDENMVSDSFHQGLQTDQCYRPGNVRNEPPYRSGRYTPSLDEGFANAEKSLAKRRSWFCQFGWYAWTGMEQAVRREVDRFHIVLSQRPTSLAYVESYLLVYRSDPSNKQHLRSNVTGAWHEFWQKFGVSSFYGG